MTIIGLILERNLIEVNEDNAKLDALLPPKTKSGSFVRRVDVFISWRKEPSFVYPV